MDLFDALRKLDRLGQPESQPGFHRKLGRLAVSSRGYTPARGPARASADRGALSAPGDRSDHRAKHGPGPDFLARLAAGIRGALPGHPLRGNRYVLAVGGVKLDELQRQVLAALPRVDHPSLDVRAALRNRETVNHQRLI